MHDCCSIHYPLLYQRRVIQTKAGNSIYLHGVQDVRILLRGALSIHKHMETNMLNLLLPILGNIGAQVAKSLFPDPADELKRADAEKQFVLATVQQAQAIEQAAADIVKAEAASENWLASSWRPITMLIFVVLIVARWFGWAAPNLAEEEYIKLWSIVELGLGGYVIGRSAEKILPAIAATMNRK